MNLETSLSLSRYFRCYQINNDVSKSICVSKFILFPSSVSNYSLHISRYQNQTRMNSGRYGRGRKMTDSDDDMPVLSDFAQQALQQFLAEQQAAAQIEQEMLEQGEDDKKAEVELKEDWQLRKRGYFLMFGYLRVVRGPHSCSSAWKITITAIRILN